jgi:hypothetical protein
VERVPAATVALVVVGGAAAVAAMQQLGDDRALLAALMAALVLAAATGIGALALRALGVFALLDRERFVWSAAAGVGLLGQLMFALAHLKLFSPLAAGALVAAGLLALARECKELAADLRALRFSPWLLAIAPAALLVVVRCTAPPTFYDALVYHLGLPMQFAARGGAFVSEASVFTAMPLLGELAASPALLLGGPEAFGLVSALLFLLAAGACAATARAAFGAEAAGPAAFVFATAPLTISFAVCTKPDLLAALCALGALRAVVHVANDADAPAAPGPARAPWALLFSLFLGLGAATKTFFLPLAASMIVVVLAWPRLRRGFAPDSARPILWGALLFVALASPPYVRNWIAFGDPLWPFLTGVLGDDTPQLAHTRAILAGEALKVRSLSDLLALWRLPYDLSFVTPSVMNDVLGALPLLGVLLAVLEKNRPRALAPLLVLLVASLPAWLLTYRLVRYDPLLFTVAPLAAGFALARALARPLGRPLVSAIVAPAALASLMWSFAADEALLRGTARYLLRQEERDELLARVLAPYPAFAAAKDALPEDACLLLAIDDPRIAFLEVPALVSERYAEPLVARLVRADDPLAAARALGATHVLASRHLGRALERFGWPQPPTALEALLSSLGEPLYDDGTYTLHAVPGGRPGGCR